MTISKWTRIVTWALKNKGKAQGYKVNSKEETFTVKIDKHILKIKPDVVWSIESKPRFIFEIDTGSRDTYQKTIYGSILSGLVLAKQKKAIFVEITPRGKSGKKAKLISKIIKKNFRALPTFCVIEVGRIRGKYSKENIQKSLTRELRKNNLIR